MPEVLTESPTLDAARRAQLLSDVRSGLQRSQKEIPPTWFYDAAGSQLFEEITRLPEYYLTRTEHGLLQRHAPEIVARTRPRSMVELGAGTAEKTRLLIAAALRERPRLTYVPVDVASEGLAVTAASLERAHRGLTVLPVTGDMRRPVVLPDDLPRPLLYTFLGSTIGNFGTGDAARILTGIAAQLRAGDHVLLGADLVKEPAVIEAAYNDAAGVTADFNLNVLRVLNRELGADFDLSAFRHRAFYDPQRQRVEMHLVAAVSQTVHVPGAGSFVFARGESIRTEISTKYLRSDIEGLFATAGLALSEWLTDERAWFALALGRRSGSPGQAS